MKLFDLLHMVEWNDVADALIQEYNHTETVMRYLLPFLSLKMKKPLDTDMRIVVVKTDTSTCIDGEFDEETDEEFMYTTIGRNGKLNKELPCFQYFLETNTPIDGDAEAKFGLWLTPWEKWLGMDIDSVSQAQFLPSQIVAYSLWEMTLCGNQESDMLKQREESQENLKNFKSMTVKERYREVPTWAYQMAEWEKSFSI